MQTRSPRDLGPQGAFLNLPEASLTEGIGGEPPSLFTVLGFLLGRRAALG